MNTRGRGYAPEFKQQMIELYRAGRPRIHSELRDMGLLVNHKRVGRLMCLAGIRGVSRRRGFVVTTRRDKEQKAAPDLVNRQRALQKPSRITSP